MAQEVEIEFKNILTKAEYDTLLEAYPFPAEAFSQTNYYLETPDLRLKETGSALRIRKKGHAYMLTLKEPYGDGLLETHDSLTKEEASSWLNGQPIAKEHTTKQLENKGIQVSDLKYFGSLTTERRELKEGNYILVLDYSTYNNQEDYEFELEASKFDEGEKIFHDILEKHQIPNRPTPNKIERFFMNLKNLDGRH
jgi:uncharacterized protein YjbK